MVGIAGNSSAASAGLRAYGITASGRQLLTFTTDDPTVNDWVRNVTGLSVDTALIGIDFRPQDGLLYGVGNYGGVYTISMPGAVLKKVSQLSVPLHGSMFGVDFNPAANRLRVISDTGQNLRHNISDGSTAGTTVVDKSLTTPPSTAAATGVTAAAYTNNDLNSDTATTLFALNTVADQVVVQSPANDGLLAPTGRLGPDAGPNAGFDIYSDLANGKTVSQTGYAVLMLTDGSATFCTVDLLTGAATVVGEFPLPVGDVAVALDMS
ncbi:DUF4394 domain-containing protein [Plantactinospora soyae]|uniref:DUF4394 domain-containing protein n=1 Tax=Plantactinospora soyae TaxID=1544732 RepID=A0A927MBE8_9ACTN|nr:DUF4394 domain-containing protein [Plantactinospora soyae]MBE1491359.1 hypothetical protein [Plantactinospora soyae]